MPLVSVIMSAFNCERFVTEAVQSILQQTYHNIEIIIVEDKSTDNTLERLRAIKDERIRLVCNVRNCKLTHNLNGAIQLSRGKYIARMDCDDISHPDRIKIQVEYMEKHTEIDVLGSYAQTFEGSSAVLRYPIEHEEIKANLLFSNSLCHPAIMFRKKAINSWYDESYPAGQDYELWSRLVWKNKMHNIPQQLFKYRVHGGQTVKKNGDLQKAGAQAARIRMIEKLGYKMSPAELKCYESIVDIGRPKSLKEMIEIQELLQKMIAANRGSKKYDAKALSTRCAKAFFDNWYCSFGQSDLSLSVMYKSPFASALWKCPTRQKMGIFMKMLHRQNNRK